MYLSKISGTIGADTNDEEEEGDGKKKKRKKEH